MVNYERPELVEVSDFVETVNLASGGESNSHSNVRWKGHDSGTHSVLGVMGYSDAGYSTDHVRGTVIFNGVEKIRVAVSNPTDGNTGCSVTLNGRVIQFTANVHSNGNGTEPNDLGLGSFEFSRDNGVTWTAWNINGGDCGEYEYCDDLFTAYLYYY